VLDIDGSFEVKTKSKKKMSSKRAKLNEHQEGFTTDPAFLKQLINTNIMHIRPENNISYVCSRADSVLDVWKGLNRHRFMSVPVLGSRDRYEGYIEIGDIVAFFANWFSLHTIRRYPTLHQLIEADKAFLGVTVDKLIRPHASNQSPSFPVSKDFSFYYCIELLARGNLERVPIVNENGVLYNFLTQSHVVEYLHKNIDKIGNKRNKPVKQIDFPKSIQIISQDQLAYDAFMQMNHHNTHGLAVLDEKNHVVGALSCRDLKLIMDEKIFGYLLEPIKIFMDRLNTMYPERSKIPIVAKGEDTLSKVIDLLMQHKLHRVFVIDEKHHPIGVMGLKEILLEIVQE